MGEVSWVEVSFAVNGELAEAIAETISRYVSNGVVVESGVDYKNGYDPGSPNDEVRVYGYIPVDDELEDTKQRINEAIWHLSQIQFIPEPAYRTIEDQDWMESWKKNYHPIPVGKRLIIVPAWLESPDPERVVVKIDPSMAFGTGTHPTTQLCLEMIDRYIETGQTFIDVGCGSGILSIAALKLGAAHALCVDVDKASVISTGKNAQNNDVKALVETGLGSVREILENRFSLRQAPIVAVNIIAPIILQLFDAGLAELVEKTGKLLLSGILEGQSTEIEEAAQNSGLKLIHKLQQEDWISLAYEK